MGQKDWLPWELFNSYRYTIPDSLDLLGWILCEELGERSSQALGHAADQKQDQENS